jgi:glycerol-3-phosphate acyltransferase PlsX
MRIVLDAMGGDYAPQVTVAGAIEAAKQQKDDRIILVGSQDVIEGELLRYSSRPKNLQIVHAEEVIRMDEPAALSVRKKRNSSIKVGLDLVKEKKADAFISAGNTGAVVCAATLGLGLLKNIERPGIAIVVPTLKGISLMIDVGANIDPKPMHLLQYAIMGTAYTRYILHKRNPRVGILNIGEEESKGTSFIKESRQLLEASSLVNFVGNVEGKVLFSGDCDVVVCDGFVGNIVLKVTESVAEAFAEFLKRELTDSLVTRLGGFLSKPAFAGLKKIIDYSEYGGAPLLGVDGVCIISHGRSSSKAIKNAIRVATETLHNRVNYHIEEALRHPV